MATKLAKLAEKYQSLPVNQYAKKGSSTVDAINLVVKIIQKSRKKKRIVSLIALDLENAFPKTSHTKLIETLKKKKIPTYLISYVQSFLVERRTQVIIPGYKADWKPASTGIL